MITQLISINALPDNVYQVTAVVEDSHCVYPATRFEPAEYGDGLCQATFMLADDESIPSHQDGLCNFINALELDWVPVCNN